MRQAAGAEVKKKRKNKSKQLRDLSIGIIIFPTPLTSDGLTVCGIDSKVLLS